MSFQSSFKIRKVDDLTRGQAKSTITLAQISGFNIYCIFMIGTLLNGCNPEIPECGLSARRIVGGVDAAPGQWPWAAIVGTPIITTVGSEPGIQGLLKAMAIRVVEFSSGRVQN